jgi:pilus assembly protein CpaB
MRSTKTIILLIVALGCGLIFTIGISQVLGKPGAGGDATEMIFVTTTNVPSYSKLTADVVTQEEWPKDKVPQDALRSLEEFEGRSPRYPLFVGEPIVLSKLASDKSQIASERIPAGHQVLAVKVDKESALGGLVNPGDKVDVLVFMSGRNGTEKIKTGTRTILRNITVFAVNDQMARDPGSEGSSIDAKTVSLLVLPEQSERLLLAKQLGTISLALRKPGDTADMDTNGASPRDLLEESDGSDTSEKIAGTNSNSSRGGVFGILQDMQAATSTTVDTSTEPVAVGGSQMVIMSPKGVMKTFSFTAAGGLPEELLNGSHDLSNGEFDEEDLDVDEDAASPIDELDAEIDGLDDVLDPSELGL